MIRRIVIILSLSAYFTQVCNAQYITGDERLRELVNQYGQSVVTVPYTDSEMVDYLSGNVSVLNVRNGLVELSLSSLTVEWFIGQHYLYKITSRVAPKELVSASTLEKAFGWETYPTYSQYDSIMQSFATAYPALCRLDTIGTSTNGKLVLVLKISDNPDIDESEPEVFYTSTMHGDETGGFILMLRLADYLLQNYDNQPGVKELIDNLQIWINPLANPDGTYNSGNAIVSPVRYNAHGVDLNRNFPDPTIADAPREKETTDMIQFMKSHRFVLSANFHSGSEVVNYPWDRWLTILHADNEWFNDISRGYADTVHAHSASGYMTDLDNGVTRGAVWYVIHGGRQDFMTQELHGREVTIELDYQYVTPASQLGTLWENNRRSLTGYLANALYGVHGTVLEAGSSAPLAAEVFISGHDIDGSQVYSDSAAGTFVRMLAPGTWPLTFTSTGFRDTTITVTVNEGQRTDLTVLMEKKASPPDSSFTQAPALYPNPSSSVINAILPDEVTGDVNVSVIDLSGKIMIFYDTEAYSGIPLQIDISGLSAGTYSVLFHNGRKNTSSRGRIIVIK